MKKIYMSSLLFCSVHYSFANVMEFLKEARDSSSKLVGQLQSENYRVPSQGLSVTGDNLPNPAQQYAYKQFQVNQAQNPYILDNDDASAAHLDIDFSDVSHSIMQEITKQYNALLRQKQDLYAREYVKMQEESKRRIEKELNNEKKKVMKSVLAKMKENNIAGYMQEAFREYVLQNKSPNQVTMRVIKNFITEYNATIASKNTDIEQRYAVQEKQVSASDRSELQAQAIRLGASRILREVIHDIVQQNPKEAAREAALQQLEDAIEEMDSAIVDLYKDKKEAWIKSAGQSVHDAIFDAVSKRGSRMRGRAESVSDDSDAESDSDSDFE